MTVRYVLVAIDDEQPLGPQMRAALGVLSWETVRELTGNAFGLRRLRQIFDSAEISARHTVAFGSMLRPHAASPFREVYAMASLFGGGQAQVTQPVQPVTPTPDDTAAQDAQRKELAADQASVGRSQTILTQYALATQQPNTLKATLGGA